MHVIIVFHSTHTNTRFLVHPTELAINCMQVGLHATLGFRCNTILSASQHVTFYRNHTFSAYVECRRTEFVVIFYLFYF